MNLRFGDVVAVMFICGMVISVTEAFSPKPECIAPTFRTEIKK